MPPDVSDAATSVTRPFVVSTVVPTGSCWPAPSTTNFLLPGSLIFTVPDTGSALTVWPGAGEASGRANPRITITRSPPPNVENRKSPVTGSKNAPSAPSSPVTKVRRDATTGSPFALTV